MIKSFNELEEILKSRESKPKLAVVCAHDMHTLEAVCDAVSKNLIEAILIGKSKEIKSMIDELKCNINGFEIIESESDTEAAAIGVDLVREDKANALMKGKIQTKDFLKAVVNSETGIKSSPVLSHMAVHEIPTYHKLLTVTDGGMLTYPDVNDKKAIIENAVGVYNRLGYEKPNVGVLTAVEVINPKMQETVDAAELKNMDIENCYVEGPISYDLAFSKESAQIKGYESPLVGEVDILVVPNIATGNILGKSLIYSAKATMVGIVVGAKVPIVLTSRGASSDEKFYSILLAVLSN